MAALGSGIKISALILLALMIVAFSLFTFSPACPLFCDPVTGQYGL